jgi:RimJ/RimL family protein N-acetyltransferase
LVEILFKGGKARELQESDISSLIEMCEDEDILKYFFSSGNRDMALSWNFQLAEKSLWEGRIDISRSRYILPIEHDGIVKGCLTLEIKVDIPSKKRQMNELTQSYWQDSSFSKKPYPLDWTVYKKPKKGIHLSRGSKSNQVKTNGPLVEKSYFIGQEYRRNGIATGVTMSSLTFASEELGARKIIAKILKSNVACRAVLERQGFRVEKKSISASGPLAGERIFIYNLSSTIIDDYFIG